MSPDHEPLDHAPGEALGDDPFDSYCDSFGDTDFSEVAYDEIQSAEEQRVFEPDPLPDESDDDYDARLELWREAQSSVPDDDVDLVAVE